jgi:uroporphyrinogen decarboxylase
MTTRERMSRMFAHQEADRIPITDSPWRSTIDRWHREGMPEGVSFTDYFGLDRFESIRVDTSPRYPVGVVSETDEYVVATTAWGATQKSFKKRTSSVDFLDYVIKDPDAWREAKERMTPSKDRIPWEHLQRNYRKWREAGSWIDAGLFFGFDVTHARVVGTDRLLIAMAEDPEWVREMFGTMLELNLTLLDMVWDAGYEFDAVQWPDDMGYKHSQFFSIGMYRDLLKPFHARAVEWAHAKGIKAHLHSCGDVNPFVPELIEIGMDGLNPLEVKAGMDPVDLKAKYGDTLLFKGGLNALLYEEPEAMLETVRRVVPAMMEHGGYVFATDHSVPDNVSLEFFKQMVELVKEIGAY